MHVTKMTLQVNAYTEKEKSKISNCQKVEHKQPNSKKDIKN